MNLEKIKTAADEVIANNLIVPEMCVITISNSGEIQLWWSRVCLIDVDKLCSDTFRNLHLTNRGNWLSSDPMDCCVSLGHDPNRFNDPFCQRYTTFKNLNIEVDSEEIKPTEETLNFLTAISNASKVPSSEKSKYEIETLYRVDMTDFRSKEEAEKFVKINLMFDLIKQSEPEADYFNYEAFIKAVVDNPNDLINILKGKNE
jgi:hypothetical protein